MTNPLKNSFNCLIRFVRFLSIKTLSTPNPTYTHKKRATRCEWLSLYFQLNS